jgi:parvulin-like peptidyl-prolyl isomerase
MKSLSICFSHLFALSFMQVAGIPGAMAQESAETATEPKTDPEIVARIGEATVITQKEFDQMVGKTRQLQMAHGRRVGQSVVGDMSPEKKLELLERMVDTKVLYLLAKKAGYVSPEADAQAQERLDGMKEQVAESGQDFAVLLDREGVTEQDLKETLLEQIVRNNFVTDKTKEITAAETEVTDLYEKLKEAGRLDRAQETVDVAHILVRVIDSGDEQAWADAKRVIDDARARVVSGEDFAEVAAEVSNDPGSRQRGGLYTEVQRGKMVPEFDKLAFESPVGEISEPFKTSYGWHILTVKAKHAAGTRALDEVHDRIKRGIEQEKRMAALNELIKQGRTAMNVEIYLKPDETAPKAEEMESDVIGDVLNQPS